MEATHNDINLVANHAKQPFLFSKEAVQHSAFLLLEEHKKAVLRICDAFKPKNKKVSKRKNAIIGSINSRPPVKANKLKEVLIDITTIFIDR